MPGLFSLFGCTTLTLTLDLWLKNRLSRSYHDYIGQKADRR